MKKHLLYIFSLCISIGLQAQKDVIEYKAAPTTSVNEACKGFSLQDGFSFKATSTSSMTFRVNTAACIAQTSTTNISANQNYVVTLTPLGQTRSVTYNDKTITVDRSIEGDVDVLTQIQYFDGLGRPVQIVQRGITPTKSDLVTYQEYDAVGREERSWLPSVGAGNNGAFMTLANVKTKANTTYGDSVAYSKLVYEASPLNRVLEQYGPGAAWKSTGAVKTRYLTNVATGEAKLICSLFTVDGSGLTTKVKRSGNYAANELYVTELKDEVGNLSYEFKDKLGQVVLTRQINLDKDNKEERLDTYYVYDDFGNLGFVLPPLVSDVLIATTGSWDNTNSTPLAQYGYIYRYDARNRCVHKKLPGADWIYYVYDKADRLIFTQDGEQRTKGEWLFSLPDALARVRLSGICTKMKIGTATTETAITIGSLDNILVNATWAKATNTFKGYTISGATPSTFSVLTANYYDSYEFMGLNGIPSITDTHFKPETIGGYGVQYTRGYKGLLTGSWTALLDGSTSGIYSVMYYDYKGQVIQTKSNNHLPGGIEKEYIAYTFAGSPTQKMHVHMASGKTTQTEIYTYAYDHAGRMTASKHKLNNGVEVLLAQNTYDELGRLNTITANNQPNLKTTYAYNIRSWTNNITNTHFVENLTYNLNGNIATQNWLQANKNRTYTFAYDNLSRMKSATYTGDGNFQTAYSYDKMGNIKTIQRYGVTAQGVNDKIIDNLTLDYTGNQLNYITDAGPNVSLSASADFKDYSKVTAAEYTFNKNGAMTKDLNKGIQGILYNSLNLPQEMVISHVTARAKNYYTYTATGTKLRVIHKSDPALNGKPELGSTATDASLTTSITTDYVGNKIYEAGTLKTILTDNGYIEGNTYYFYIKDHLGNNRIVANASASVVQSNQYYPFGMAFAEATTTEQGKQEFKYNGKELDRSHELNQYDYSARFYDPGYNRFTTMDPHSENYYSWSPYVYVGNNPMRLVDPDGKDWRDFIRGIGEGAIQKVDNIVAAVSNPGKTLENALKPAGSVGEAVFNAVDQASMGMVSTTINGGQAVYSDLNGGDGSATGQLIGGAIVDATVAVATGKAGEAVGKGVSALSKESATVASKASTVQANRAAGNAFRDELAAALKNEGRSVSTEVYKKTPFGKRFIDIEVSAGGKVLGGIEAKTGGSRYTPSQRAKDFYLKAVHNYKVDVVRKPVNW